MQISSSCRDFTSLHSAPHHSSRDPTSRFRELDRAPSDVMAPKMKIKEIFCLSGPVHLTSVNWDDAKHRKSVAASLVQGVYLLERDRQKKRQNSEALAPPWWEFFHFRLLRQLVDDADNSIFGAIYEFIPSESSHDRTTSRSPRYVIAFRGTLIKPKSFYQDLKQNLQLIKMELHRTSRFEIAMQAVTNMVATVGDSDIWLAGHSLGSCMAMLAGKTMAKNGNFLEAYLFNPPFFSAPIERIKNEKVEKWLRTAGSVTTAVVALAMQANHPSNLSENPFIALSGWIPSLFVNPGDHICSEYMGYFEHRENMEEIGAGGIERLATQNSIVGLLLKAFGREIETVHLIPSAHLIVNPSPSQDFIQAHGLQQWWQPDMLLQSKLFTYR